MVPAQRGGAVGPNYPNQLLKPVQFTDVEIPLSVMGGDSFRRQETGVVKTVVVMRRESATRFVAS